MAVGINCGYLPFNAKNETLRQFSLGSWKEICTVWQEITSYIS